MKSRLSVRINWIGRLVCLFAGCEPDHPATPYCNRCNCHARDYL